MKLNLTEDMHIHSTFSDGADSIYENAEQAEKVGLHKITCVDHVRKDTDWLGEYVVAVENLKTQTNVSINIGIETKILNESGELDMPQDISGVEKIYAADHQIPFGDRCYTPKEIRSMFNNNEVTENEIIQSIVIATTNTLSNYKNVVIAHLFSVLPKIHLSEDDVKLEQIEYIAKMAKQTDAQIEVDERWKCPQIRTLSVFQAFNVPIIFSSDSHRKETIGKYTYNAEIYKKLTSR